MIAVDLNHDRMSRRHAWSSIGDALDGVAVFLQERFVLPSDLRDVAVAEASNSDRQRSRNEADYSITGKFRKRKTFALEVEMLGLKPATALIGCDRHLHATKPTIATVPSKYQILTMEFSYSGRSDRLYRQL